MKPLLLSALLLAAATAPAIDLKQQVQRPEGVVASPFDLKYPELKFKPLAIETRKLSNGIQVYFAVDHELPFISGSFLFPSGEETTIDPSKAGFGDLFGTMLVSGGTKSLGPDALAEELESMGASIRSTMGRTTLSVSMGCLTQDFPRVLTLLTDVVQNPAFDKAEFKTEKARSLDEVRRRKDEPQAIAQVEFKRALFGSDSPLGAVPTEKTIARIERRDLQDWHRNYMGPQDLRIGFAGDINPDELVAALEQHFGSMKAEGRLVGPAPVAPKGITPGVRIIDKQVSQTQIRFGALGLPLLDPDFFVSQVYNEVYGMGGFSSRLMREVRSNRGLAYGVNGAIMASLEGGQFINATATKNPTAREAYDVMVKVLKSMQDEPVPQDELDRAKNSITNSFIFRFDDKQGAVDEKMLYDLRGYPADYLATYLDHIKAVTAADVQRFAKEHTDPANLVTVLVGPAEELKEQFDGLGEITVSQPE